MAESSYPLELPQPPGPPPWPPRPPPLVAWQDDAVHPVRGQVSVPLESDVLPDPLDP